MKKPIFWILLIIILSVIVFVYKKHKPGMRINTSSSSTTPMAKPQANHTSPAANAADPAQHALPPQPVAISNTDDAA